MTEHTPQPPPQPPTECNSKGMGICIPYCPLHQAAPELLAQLKIAINCLYGLNRFDMERMRQAIAKAEGK